MLYDLLEIQLHCCKTIHYNNTQKGKQHPIEFQRILRKIVQNTCCYLLDNCTKHGVFLHLDFSQLAKE